MADPYLTTSIGIFFCNPDCPFCPPNIFPNDGGNDNNDDDDDDDDPDPKIETVVVNIFDDTRGAKIPSKYVDMSELNAIDAALSSRVRDDFDWPKTTTTMTTKPPTTTTEKPKPTPMADCMFWDNFLFYVFEIYNIDGWVTDGGEKLKDEEDGCATLTGWDWHEADSDSYAYVFFNLDFFIKAGCVERAIVSAGGPKISCKGGGIWWGDGAEQKPKGLTLQEQRKRPGMITRPRPYTKEEMRQFERIYKNLQPPGNQTNHTYIPMDWGKQTVTRNVLPTMTAA